MRIAVIGGGASGLAAAVSIQLNRPAETVAVFEKQARVGRKLLITGNGRCNLTSAIPEPEFPAHYSDEAAARTVLAACGRDRTLAFFRRIGLLTARDGNGIYPATFQASTVLDVLREALLSSGGIERCGEEVREVRTVDGGFLVNGEKFDRVILSAGGSAGGGKKTGAERLAAALGHTVIPPVPALVPVKVSSPFLKGLSGIRTRAAVTLTAGALTALERGEVLFRDYGLSGVAVFQLSRIMAEEAAHGRGSAFSLTLDLLPEGAEEVLLARKKRYAALPAEAFFSGVLNKKIGQRILDSLGGFSRVGEVDAVRAADAARRVKFSGVTPLPFDMAQTAAGGVPLAEVELPSMRSLKTPGLFLTGEALDVTGACGGYNLQWAWSTGILAGEAAAC